MINNRTTAILGVLSLVLVQLLNVDFSSVLGPKTGPAVHLVLLTLCGMVAAIGRNPMGPTKTAEKATIIADHEASK